MKKIFYHGTVILCIIVSTSCRQTENKNKNTDDNHVNNSTLETADTSGYFIKSILNCSSNEVAKILGEPDTKIKPSKDCDYLPSCDETTYRNGKYEVLYYKDKLKWITVNEKGHFNKDAIRYVGFESCEPTFFNPSIGIWWRNLETKGTATGPLIPIKGLREICAFPSFLKN